MATDPAPEGTNPPTTVTAKLHAEHRPWTRYGKPENLKRHIHWVYGQQFDVLEDETGVIEVRRHRDAHRSALMP